MQDCREVSSGYGYGSQQVGVTKTITWSVAPNVGHCSGHGMFRVPSPEASQEVCWGAQADLRQEEASADLQGDHQAHLQAGGHVTWYQGVNWGKFSIPGQDTSIISICLSEGWFTETMSLGVGCLQLWHPRPPITPPPPEPNILRLNCAGITGIACQQGDKLNAQPAQMCRSFLSRQFCAKQLPRWLGRNFNNEFYWDEMGAIGFALIELFDKLIIPMYWDCGPPSQTQTQLQLWLQT